MKTEYDYKMESDLTKSAPHIEIFRIYRRIQSDENKLFDPKPVATIYDRELATEIFDNL